MRLPGFRRAREPIHARERRHVGVAGLLLTLILIPLGGMIALGVSVISTRANAVRHATHVSQGLARVTALIGLRQALHAEAMAADVHLRFRRLPPPPPAGAGREAGGSDLPGLGGGPGTADTRALTDRALMRYAMAARAPMSMMMTPRVPLDEAALRVLRARIDHGSAAAEDVDGGYEALDGQADDALHTLLGGMATMIGRVDQGYGVWAALETLHAASDGLGASTAEVADVSELSRTRPGAAPAMLVELGETTAQYRKAEESFVGEATGRMAGAWAAVERAPAVAGYERTVATMEADPVASERRFARTPGVGLQAVEGGFARDARLSDLVNRAAAAPGGAAAVLVANARRDYHAWLAVLIVLALVTIAVTLALARFITRPMRRLATVARSVSGGELDVATALPSGPRETADVGRAFGDLVTNLRLLEAKTHALASCDFESLALRAPLPGQLGQAIERSVAALSGSIEERTRLEHRLTFQATHDALTGLNNRAAALTALEQALRRARRTGDGVAAMYVDLDDFKQVNDHHGQRVGDHILRVIADRMQDAVRGGEFLARIGGDEFLVVAEGISDAPASAALARRLIDAVRAPIEHEGRSFTVTASVGIATALDFDEDPGQLLAHADLALHRATQRDPASIEIYDQTLQDELRRRADIEQALSAALAPAANELVLHYQPVVSCPDGRLAEVEALIRWDRPGLGRLAPDAFIPVAEGSDLIVELDLWVLRQVAAQLIAWSAVPDLADVAIAVNISGRHLLGGELDDHVRAVLEETGIEPQRLILEITETVILADLPAAADQLEKVRARGVRVAIDDFGTGYTSIAHLQRLPVDTIKIDRSFVRQVEEQREGSLVRMVTDLSHHIGVSVVAEGVETAGQREVLSGLGCDHLQGFLFSRPRPATDIPAWVAALAGGPDGRGRRGSNSPPRR